MGDYDKRASSTRKKKMSLLDEDIEKEFLGSWDSAGSTGGEMIDFNIEPLMKGKNIFEFGKLDMDFSIDEFEKMSAFKVDISDLDFSKPPKKSIEGSEEKSGKDPHQGNEGNFTFSFDFNELDNVNLDLPLRKEGHEKGGKAVDLSGKTQQLHSPSILVVDKDGAVTDEPATIANNTLEITVASKLASETQVSFPEALESPDNYLSKSKVLLETKRVLGWPDGNTLSRRPTEQQNLLSDKTTVQHFHDTSTIKNQNNLIEETASKPAHAELKTHDQVHRPDNKTATKQSDTQTKALEPIHSRLGEKRAQMQSNTELEQQGRSYLPVEIATEQSCTELKSQNQNNSSLVGKEASKQSAAQLKNQDQGCLWEKMNSTPEQAHIDPKVPDQNELLEERSLKLENCQLKELCNSAYSLSDSHATEAAISKQMDVCPLEAKSEDGYTDLLFLSEKPLVSFSSDCKNSRYQDSSSKHVLKLKNNEAGKNNKVNDTQDTRDSPQNAASVSQTVSTGKDFPRRSGDADSSNMCVTSVLKNMPYQADSTAEHQRSPSMLKPSLVSSEHDGSVRSGKICGVSQSRVVFEQYRRDSGFYQGYQALAARTKLPSLDRNKKVLMVAGSAAAREKEDPERALCEGKLAKNPIPSASEKGSVSNETAKQTHVHDASSLEGHPSMLEQKVNNCCNQSDETQKERVSNDASSQKNKMRTFEGHVLSSLTHRYGNKIHVLTNMNNYGRVATENICLRSSLAQKDKTVRDLKKVRFQGNRNTGHSLGTIKQTQPTLSLKRRISEVHACENLVDSSTQDVYDEQFLCTFGLPQETKGVDSDRNIEKAVTFGKELGDLCDMLKKKQEEAKELLVRAIMNHDNLLLLNHSIYEQRISFCLP